MRFHSLLLSFRTIYEEVAEVLYSTNVFEISYKRAESLRRVRNLRDASLSSLRELKVVLNQASCHHEQCFDCCEDAMGGRLDGTLFNYCQERHTDLHGEALRPLDDSAASLFAEWRLTAAYIWSRITPERLSISLVCDFEAEHENTPSAARLTVAPLINLSPLKGCHVRLSRTPHPKLKEIARETVLRAVGIVDREELALTPNTMAIGDSKFISLPREIRFQILEYTDLITPWREVKWTKQRRGYIPTLINCIVDDCPPQLHSGCQFRKCWYAIGPP